MGGGGEGGLATLSPLQKSSGTTSLLITSTTSHNYTTTWYRKSRKLSEIFWAYTLNHWLFSKFTEGDIGFNCCVIQLSGGLKAPGWQRNKILMWFFSTCCCHDLSKNPRRKDLSKGQDFYHSKVLWYPTSLSNRPVITASKQLGRLRHTYREIVFMTKMCSIP